MSRSKPTLVDCACDIYLAYKNSEISGKDDWEERRDSERSRALLNNKIYRSIKEEEYFQWLEEHPNCWNGWSGKNHRQQYDEIISARQRLNLPVLTK